MACLNMYNEQQHSVDPRISFSNDFADSQQQAAVVKQESSSNYREAPVSSDFDFSVRNYNLIPADEIFFKGMLVPLKENSGATQLRKMTLREELLVNDEYYNKALPRMPKSSGWWKERLGLKKAHIISKKGDRNDGVLGDIVEEKSCVFAHEEEVEPVGKTIQELLLACGDAGI